MYAVFRIYLEEYVCLNVFMRVYVHMYVYVNGVYVYIGYNARKISCSPYGWPFPLTLHPPSCPEVPQESHAVSACPKNKLKKWHRPPPLVSIINKQTSVVSNVDLFVERLAVTVLKSPP